MAELLRTINRWIHRGFLIVAEIALGAMVVIVLLTVILRFFFNTGLSWAEEVPRLLVGYFAFIACAMGVRDRMHISMNIVYNIFPKEGAVRRFMVIFGDICVCLCGLFMLYYGGSRCIRMMSLPGMLPITQWPNWVRYAVIPLAGFTIAFDSILYITGVLRPEDLLFSEKEEDYTSQVISERKKIRQQKEGK